MFMKILVNAFERAKSRIISTHSTDQVPSELDHESDTSSFKQNFAHGSLVVHQQPRSTSSKWLCSTSTSYDKSISSKTHKVRRSTSWRSLKERGTNLVENFSSRTLSVDELDRNDKRNKIDITLRQPIPNRHGLPSSSMTNASHQFSKTPAPNRIRLSNRNESKSLSTHNMRLDRLSSTFVDYSEKNKKSALSTNIYRRNNRDVYAINNQSSVGGDSGYSEESFSTTLSPYTRSYHTSCPHCHCERHSSFNKYNRSNENSSTDSLTSDTTARKEINSTDVYYHLFKNRHHLSASRSYPHIKPLPKTQIQSQANRFSTKKQSRRDRPYEGKRNRHLSCDGSLWSRARPQQSNNERSSPDLSESNYTPLQFHSTTNGTIHHDQAMICSKIPATVPKPTNVFDEINLAAIELDSLRTLDYFGTSLCSSYSSSLTSSSSSINTDRKLNNGCTHNKKSSRQRRTYLVWHEYRNSSLLSATNGGKKFSVVRGDQVRLLRRIGKSTLLVKKEEDGSIGFLPQSCLAHDQIHSFLSVKGVRETVL